MGKRCSGNGRGTGTYADGSDRSQHEAAADHLHGCAFLCAGPPGNGYRPGHSYGQGKKLEFRIARDRYGNFHPQILAILRDQEEECDRLAGVLYTKGLTQEQVSDVFDQIYGQHYSKSMMV